MTRKEQITTVATNMFQEKGYNATSMRDLASKVGIEPASLYNHIKSKGEILQNICFEIAGQFIQEVEEAIAYHLDPEKRLRAAIKGHLMVIEQNREAAAVFFQEWKFLQDPYLSDFMIMRRNYEGTFHRILMKGQKEGVFLQGSEKALAAILFSAMNETHHWYFKTSKGSIDEVSDLIANIFLTGIKK